MTIAVDELGRVEWQRWRRIRLAALLDAADAFGSSYEEWADADDAAWQEGLRSRSATLVARLDGRDVGVGCILEEEEHGPEIISLWVDPRVRGCGVGDALVAGLVQRAGELDPGAGVRLAVKSGNAPAQRLYVRHGFRPAGPNPEDETEILMLLAAG
jgi:ribosomal protein S18 acetylase RimI-like enzyme